MSFSRFLAGVSVRDSGSTCRVFKKSIQIASGISIVLATGLSARAQVQFTDVTTASGIQFVNHHQSASAGVIAADITGDGFPELFFNDQVGFDNELYLNNGDGTFTEVGAQWGVRSRFNTPSALFVDWDNDGVLDFLMLQIVKQDVAASRILRNAGDHFEAFPRADRIPVRGLLGNQMTSFDYDGDGYLDLVTTGGRCDGLDDQNLILRNDQAGSFEILMPFMAQEPGCVPWQPVAADLDGDGLTDVFCARDFDATSRVYLHQLDGSMLDVGVDLGLKLPTAPDMGVAIADYDNDGDLDIYTTDITRNTQGGNRLFQNQLSDTGVFVLSEVARKVGVFDSGVGWGASFFDYDNDAHLDLAVSSMNEASRIFHNRGDATYDDVGAQLGFDPAGMAEGLVSVDFDMDGDLDVVIANQMGPAQVYRNDGGDRAGSWIKIRLIDDVGGDPFAVGSKIWIQAGDQTLFHQTKTGVSFNSQEPYLLHFGLGSGVGSCIVTVQWPDGEMSVGVVGATGEILTIRRSRGAPFHRP